MRESTWTLLGVSAGREQGPGQHLWPRAGWHESDADTLGSDGPSLQFVLNGAPAASFTVEAQVLSLA